MANQNPKLSSIVIGLVLAIIATMLLCSIGEVLKVAGAPFLFIPSILGLTSTLGPEDVHTISAASSPVTLRLTQAGPYAVYLDDYDLLVTTDALMAQNGHSWLKVTEADTGDELPTTFIDRGVRPYDSPYVKGRPVIGFTIPHSGVYQLSMPRRNVNIYVVPDYITGNETTLTLIYVVQIGLIAGVIGYLYWRRTHVQRSEAKTRQQHWIQRANAYWEKQAAKRSDKPDDKGSTK